MRFEDWLVEHYDLKPSSANAYVGALKGALSKIANSANLFPGTLDEIESASQFKIIADRLREIPEFVIRNETGNSLLSSALDSYVNYLAFGYANDSDRSIQSDIQAISADRSVTDTTRAALIEARIGQGRFRKELIEKYEGRCAVTGLAVIGLLRASHIKPWAQSTNEERLDPENGLLLTPTLDALFDSGFISFRKDGTVFWLREIDHRDKAQLGPVSNLLHTPTARQAQYLEYHAASNRPARRES